MDAILERTNDYLRTVMQGWDTVDTVTVLKFGEDRYDPSFFLSYDVYFHGSFPEGAAREAAFSQVVMFESTVDGKKDRFLYEDIPVRVEYKAISDVDIAVSKVQFPDKGDFHGTTYGFYRMVYSDAILQRSTWLSVVRRTLNDLPQTFWNRRVEMLRAHMEHSLSDLASAVYSDEPLFYHLSLAGYLENACALLLAINKSFEPAGRVLRSAVSSLSVIPEEFDSRMDYLLGHEAKMNRNRKREVAELIAKSLLRLI